MGLTIKLIQALVEFLYNCYDPFTIYFRNKSFQINKNKESEEIEIILNFSCKLDLRFSIYKLKSISNLWRFLLFKRSWNYNLGKLILFAWNKSTSKVIDKKLRLIDKATRNNIELFEIVDSFHFNRNEIILKTNKTKINDDLKVKDLAKVYTNQIIDIISKDFYHYKISKIKILIYIALFAPFIILILFLRFAYLFQ